MYKLEEINAIHFELTESCNLRCPMCDRNDKSGRTNKYLKGRQLFLDDIRNGFPPNILKQIKRSIICGNYGDPILAIDMLDILKYFKLHNPDMVISVNTNGYAKNTSWWKELAPIVSRIKFGIDGLEDTHDIYRKGSDWDIIIRNAKAFIDAGGTAVWDYIIFGHNEHQIEEARKLSEELGFKEFITKKTGRITEGTGLTRPKLKENINKSIEKENRLIEIYGSKENYFNKTKVSCSRWNMNQMYVSAEGLVLPCCWIAGQLYKWWEKEKTNEVWKYIDVEKVNIKTSSLKEIFESGVFDKIEASWSLPTIEEGKLKICSLKCGEEIDHFGDQFK